MKFNFNPRLTCQVSQKHFSVNPEYIPLYRAPLYFRVTEKTCYQTNLSLAGQFSKQFVIVKFSPLIWYHSGHDSDKPFSVLTKQRVCFKW